MAYEPPSFCLDFIMLKSTWFDFGDNMFIKMGQHEGLAVYLNLFRFRIHQLGDAKYMTHRFSTSIYALSKASGVSKSKIYNYLKLFTSLGIIKFVDIYTWRTISVNGETQYKTHLDIVASDAPCESDNYIMISLSMLLLYLGNALTYRHYALYCLVRKWSNLDHGYNKEKYCTMSMEKLALALGYHKDAVRKIIIELNRADLLFTALLDNKKGGKMSQHRIVFRPEEMDEMKLKYAGKSHKYLQKVDGEEITDWGSDPNVFDEVNVYEGNPDLS